MSEPKTTFNDIKPSTYFRFGEKYCNQVYQKWEAGDKFILPCLPKIRFNLNNLSTPFPKLGETPVIPLSVEEQVAQQKAVESYNIAWAVYRTSMASSGGQQIDIDNIEDLIAIASGRMSRNFEDAMGWQSMCYRVLELDNTFPAMYVYLALAAEKIGGWRDAYILTLEGISHLDEDDTEGQLALPSEMAYTSLNILAYQDAEKFATQAIEYAKKNAAALEEDSDYNETLSRAYLFRAMARFYPLVKAWDKDGVREIDERQRSRVDSDIAESCKLMLHDVGSFQFYVERLLGIEGIPKKYGIAFAHLCIEMEKQLIKAKERDTKKKAGFGWRRKN